ncbi:MAG: N-acetylmuramoyl-L-alanine amidase [Armatimonadota bacterium]|jgi:N-acetylmuramoyl-L-alanine amidase
MPSCAYTAAAITFLILTGGLASAQQATVAVTSHPAGAKVYVNGYYKGRTPSTVTIDSATAEEALYVFTLHLPGFKAWEAKIGLSLGQNKSLYAALERLPSAVSGRTICIDPGHPSETSPGTTGPTGVSENHINWVIATKLRADLEASGATVVMTKQTENEHVTNRRRAEIANAAGAAIMIRLHCDAAPTRGYAIYAPDRQGTRDGVTGPSRAVIDRSTAAMRPFYEGMTSVLSGTLPGRGTHGDSATYVGSRQGALTGSIFSEVPTLTIEMCVLTNARDEAFISSAAGQQKMVEALRAGLEHVFRAQ